MKRTSKRTISLLAVAASVSVLLTPVPVAAQSSGDYPFPIFEGDYRCHPAYSYHCGSVFYYPEIDFPQFPYPIHVIPAPSFPIEDYCCSHSCYPPQAGERFVKQNVTTPENDPRGYDPFYRDNKSNLNMNGFQGSNAPTGRRTIPSNEPKIMVRHPKQGNESRNRNSPDVEEESSLQGGWEIDDNSHDDHAGHDHDGHDHDGHDHGYSERK